MLPQLRKLERKWSRELAVVGVHSPKFLSERETESVRAAILRLEVGHPVVNDRDFRIWQAYAVRAWPTLMFVDPRGRVIGKHEGESSLESFDELLRRMVEEFDAAGWLDRRPLPFERERRPAPTPLGFPGKVLADEAGGRLFVSDTGGHRIVVADLEGRVRQVVGSGAPGLADGPLAEAAFDQPQGLALDGDTLYVADTYNHKLKRLDPKTGECRTLAGSGEAGHADGPAAAARFSEPSGLSAAGSRLFVADTNNHAVRVASPDRGEVTTLAFRGLTPSPGS